MDSYKGRKAERLIGRVIPMADGTSWVIPALNFRQLKELETTVAGLDKLKGTQYIDTVAQVVLPAMQRNYFDMTMEDVNELLSIECMGAALNAALGTQPRVGNVVPIRPEGSATSGEAVPVAEKG